MKGIDAVFTVLVLCVVAITVLAGCVVSLDSQLRQSDRARHELMGKFQPTIWPDTGLWIGMRHVRESEVPDLAEWLKN